MSPSLVVILVISFPFLVSVASYRQLPHPLDSDESTQINICTEIVIAILIFSLPVIAFIWACFRWWRRQVHKRLILSVLSGGTITYTVVEEEATECVICLGEFEGGEIIINLPCNHLFHHQCISSWLKKSHTSCPICRVNVTEV